MTMRRVLIILCLLPATAPASAQPDREASIRAYLRSQYQDVRSYVPDVRYTIAWVDLNGDERAEAIVRMSGQRVCGSGGCDLTILSWIHGQWRAVGDMGISQLPVRLLPGRSHGWRDIGVFVAGGGILRGYHARLSFDGRTYPSNPSAPPARALRTAGPGRVLISETMPTHALFD